MPPAPVIRSLLGTVHNYTDEDIANLKAYAETSCKYIVIGYEVCPTTARPHIHLVIQLKKQQRVTAIRSLVEPRIMNTKFPLRAVDPSHHHFAPSYVKKGEQTKEEWTAEGNKGPNFGRNANFWEYGTFVSPGERTDLKRLRDAVEQAPTFRSLVRNEDVAEVCSRNMNYARQLYDAKRPKLLEGFGMWIAMSRSFAS